jgi:hypothetical protein
MNAISPSETPPVPAAPAFPRLPGETPRAIRAFREFLGLGSARSLPALAGRLGERLGTVKTWSARYRWRERVHAFESGLLQEQAEAVAAGHRQQAADWALRTREYREQEWDASQKLLAAVQCFLESFGERDVERMTLSQVSRALHIASRLARQACSGDPLPEEPALAPLQSELAAALQRAYAQPPPVDSPSSPASLP